MTQLRLTDDPTREFINKKTIIVGEINTGKTACLNRILEKLLAQGETDVSIIDMAPETIGDIGGKMSLGKLTFIRYLTAKIVAPRLTGGSQEEVEALAKKNALSIDHILQQYLASPSKILFINDVSIYLQAGDLDSLLSLLKSTSTVVMNGYFGYGLGGGKLGERERRKMKALQEKCDRVINLKAVSCPSIHSQTD
ncbi:MAG: hypothetical protein ISS61_03850 [Desulfobacteraceae bacterium]|nr:hypothetical protein [Desulfobacteraceae bacterium]